MILTSGWGRGAGRAGPPRPGALPFRYAGEGCRRCRNQAAPATYTGQLMTIQPICVSPKQAGQMLDFGLTQSASRSKPDSFHLKRQLIWWTKAMRCISSALSARGVRHELARRRLERGRARIWGAEPARGNVPRAARVISESGKVSNALRLLPL